MAIRHRKETRDRAVEPATRSASRWAMVIAAVVIALFLMVVALSFFVYPDFRNALG